MDAVLSLRTSSQQVGAERLAALVREVEGALRVGAGGNQATFLPELAAVYVKRVQRCAEQTAAYMEAHLDA